MKYAPLTGTLLCAVLWSGSDAEAWWEWGDETMSCSLKRVSAYMVLCTCSDPSEGEETVKNEDRREEPEAKEFISFNYISLHFLTICLLIVAHQSPGFQ
jgi:hypothetical protein